MVHIGENDFLRAFDAVSEMAQKAPVTITKQGRDRLVVMSAEQYVRLLERQGQGRGEAAGERRECEARAAY